MLIKFLVGAFPDALILNPEISCLGNCFGACYQLAFEAGE